MRKTSLIDSILSVLVLVVILLTAACTASPSQTAVPDQPSETAAPISVEPTTTPRSETPISRLRIKNVGKHDLKGLVVMFPESRIAFGDVPAGLTSEYQDAPKGVYNYGAYEYQSGGETAMQPVIDWMGESPRPGQSYTYVLDYDPDREGLKIELVEVLADLN